MIVLGKSRGKGQRTELQGMVSTVINLSQLRLHESRLVSTPFRLPIEDGLESTGFRQLCTLATHYFPHVEGGGDTKTARSTRLAQGSLISQTIT
jgi:hypothetical protein